MPRTPSKPCDCGCGQAPAATTRMRKASCDCGASTIRLSRATLLTVNAQCTSCGYPLLPECLYDRATMGDHGAHLELLAKFESLGTKDAHGSGAHEEQWHCGDCHAYRKHPAGGGPCKSCGASATGAYQGSHGGSVNAAEHRRKRSRRKAHGVPDIPF